MKVYSLYKFNNVSGEVVHLTTDSLPFIKMMVLREMEALSRFPGTIDHDKNVILIKKSTSYKKIEEVANTMIATPYLDHLQYFINLNQGSENEK